MPANNVEASTTAAVATKSNKKQYFLYSVADAKIIQHHVQLGGGGSLICAANTQATNFYRELSKILGDGHHHSDSSAKPSAGETTAAAKADFGLTELLVFERFFAIGKYDGSIEV